MGSVASQLKPIQSSFADDFKAEYETFKKLDENLELTPRALVYHFIFSSAKIQCHTQFAMILLIGSTGCGKSSTINHLLDIGDGIGNKKSSSRKTSEYIFTFDEPKYEVRDLAMSVFSSPGFNNSDSIEQNACNFLSI